MVHPLKPSMRTTAKRWLAARVTPLSNRAIDVAIIAYALWTVTCHAVMFLGGDTYALTAATYAVGALSLIGLGGFLWWRSKRRGTQAAAAAAPSEADSSDEQPDRREQAILGALALVVLVLWLWLRDPMVTWIAICLYLALAFTLSVRTPLRAPRDSSSTLLWQEVAVWLLVLGGAIVSMAAHRWRNDDCYYVNLAVTIADLPHEPLLSRHTIHALGSTAVFPPYRIHTFEPLAGLLSHLTGIEAIRILHIGMAGVFGGLVPLAFARLFRLLDAQRWLFMLVAVTCLYLVDGSGDRGFANQAFVRVFTGKSVMLSIAVPLLARHALALGARPRLATFGLLLATQIATIGMSSTGLWLAPALVMLCVGATVRWDLGWLRAAGIGFLSCSYVLAIALWVRSQVMYAGTKGELSRALGVSNTRMRPRWGLLVSSFEQNIGDGTIVVLFFGLLLVAIALARTSIARRYLATTLLALSVLMMNPYFANFLRYNVYGKFTGQRAFWVAPLPAAFAIVCVALIPAHGPKLWRALGIMGSAALLAAFCVWVPTTYALGKDNHVVFKWPPEPKVPKSAFALSEELADNMSPKDIVLAPELVAWYLPTVHNHPTPLIANDKYMVVPADEKARLEGLVDLVSKRYGKLSRETTDEFIAQITHYGVDAVVLKAPRRGRPPLAAALTAASFQRVQGTPGYQLWVTKEHAQAWRPRAPGFQYLGI